MQTTAGMQKVPGVMGRFCDCIIGYGSNSSRWREWEKMKWKVGHSDHEHLYQRLRLGIYQFSESQRKGLGDCGSSCIPPCFEEVRDN